MKSEDLENHFKQFGGIISCKISLDEKHASRGYGFVCFQDSEYAKEALKVTSHMENLIGVKFNPKSRTDQRKAFNNIFVKNLPTDVTDDEIRTLFGPYGNISSLHKGQSSKDPAQKFYFVCFTSPNKDDIEYGPRCA
jgi:polyadenylate-binding protein